MDASDGLRAPTVLNPLRYPAVPSYVRGGMNLRVGLHVGRIDVPAWNRILALLPIDRHWILEVFANVWMKIESQMPIQC